MHACPGRNIILECTVNGIEGDSTVWQGTAFDNCNIILLHLRFRLSREEGNSKECNNGDIAVQNTSAEGTLYVSQLKVTINPQMVGKDIICAHDNGTDSYTIGRHLIKIGRSCYIMMCWLNVYHALISRSFLLASSHST